MLHFQTTLHRFFLRLRDLRPALGPRYGIELLLLLRRFSTRLDRLRWSMPLEERRIFESLTSSILVSFASSATCDLFSESVPSTSIRVSSAGFGFTADASSRSLADSRSVLASSTGLNTFVRRFDLFVFLLLARSPFAMTSSGPSSGRRSTTRYCTEVLMLRYIWR